MNEDIKYLANSLYELYQEMYLIYAPEVKRILKNNIKDKKQIELCLDNLLNCPTDKCYDLFLKLCTYYKKIDALSANEYLEIYKELYLDKEESMTKKRK